MPIVGIKPNSQPHRPELGTMTLITIHKVREAYGFDWSVYAGSRLVRVCPSEGMAREVAAGAR